MPVETLYTEKELLPLIVEGDENAFCILYELYHHALYRNVIKLVHTEAEAEDIIQEVFISLWENRTSIQVDKSIGGWLFVLSYNRSINYLKRKLRQQAKAQFIAEITHEPADTDHAETQWKLLEEAMHQLSPRKRKVFELCKLEGKSYEKAALEMGISKHTINEYLQEAMAFIREYVREHPSFGSSAMALLVLELFFQ